MAQQISVILAFHIAKTPYIQPKVSI